MKFKAVIPVLLVLIAFGGFSTSGYAQKQGQQNYMVDPATKKKADPQKGDAAQQTDEGEYDAENNKYKDPNERKKLFEEKYGGKKGQLPEDVQTRLESRNSNAGSNKESLPTQAAAPAQQNFNRVKETHNQTLSAAETDVVNGRQKIKEARERLEKDKKAGKVTAVQAKDREAKIKKAEEEVDKLDASIQKARKAGQ